MEYPKALQPVATKNKDGKIISWRAIYADLDDSGRRKKFTWKSFPAKFRDEKGTNKTNSKNSVFQQTVTHCEELKSVYSEALVDTDMTLMQFINEHYQLWRETNFVAPNVRLIHKATRWYIDVWPMYSGSAEEKVSPLEGKQTFEAAKKVNFVDLDYNYVDILRKDMFPLRRCLLEGIQLWCPNHPHKILRQVFRTDPIKGDHNLNRATGCWEDTVSY